MNKLLRYKDYLGTVEYSLNDKVFFGEVLGIESLLSYQGNTIEELEEDFKETLEVVNKCKFDGAFTFIYSPREGTPAAKIKDTIPLEVKENRLHKYFLLNFLQIFLFYHPN